MASTHAPGLKTRIRSDGQHIRYWVASATLIKRGYRPKTVRLHYDETDLERDAKLAHRCRVLQAEMLEWASGRPQGEFFFNGTLKSLVDMYEKNPDSPYHDLRTSTQRNYSKHIHILMRFIGVRRIDAVTGADVRRWYKNIAAPTRAGGPERTAYAYLLISILKVVVSYGASLGYDPCLKLRAQMSAAKFRQGSARKTRLTHAQLTAFRIAAHAAGKPSMALGLTLQYELAFRQRDVIGEWVKDVYGTDGVRNGRMVWRDGLTWAHIGQDAIVRKTTSKTGAGAVHRVSDYPDLLTELDRIPTEKRIGPLVLNEMNGLPYTSAQYRLAFRSIARAAGIPDGIWNMDARAGAVTEAYESGADVSGAMALATHTTPGISRRYNRDSVEQSSRVAKLRVASRRNVDK